MFCDIGAFFVSFGIYRTFVGHVGNLLGHFLAGTLTGCFLAGTLTGCFLAGTLTGCFLTGTLTGCCSHLDHAASNLETRVEANLQRSFANQPKTNDAKLADGKAPA